MLKIVVKREKKLKIGPILECYSDLTLYFKRQLQILKQTPKDNGCDNGATSPKSTLVYEHQAPKKNTVMYIPVKQNAFCLSMATDKRKPNNFINLTCNIFSAKM